MELPCTTIFRGFSCKIVLTSFLGDNFLQIRVKEFKIVVVAIAVADADADADSDADAVAVAVAAGTLANFFLFYRQKLYLQT